MINIIIVKDRSHLQEVIQEEIKLHGYEYDLNHIDVSQWNISNIIDINYMFFASKFNQTLINGT